MFKIIVLLLLLLSISRPICAQDIENEEFNTGSVINMIKESWGMLRDLPMKYRDDKDVVLAAVKQNGESLEFASIRLKGDIDVVTQAVKITGWALRFASSEMRSNTWIALLAIEEGWWYAMQYVGDSLKKNPEFIGEAITKWPFAILHVDKKFLYDEKSLFLTLKKHGWVYKDLPLDLKSRKNVLQIAIWDQFWSILQFAPAILQDDFEVAKQAVSADGLALEFVSPRLQDNKEIVLVAVKKAWFSLKYVSIELKKDKEIVLAAIQNDPSAMQFADQTYRANPDFAIATQQSLETILLRIFGLVVGWILLLQTGLIRKIIQWILQFFKKSDIEK